MKLLDLEPEFLRYERDGAGHTYYPHTDSMADAQGVMFLCPKCFEANGGSRGTHLVLCWSSSRGVPDFVDPRPGRWKLEGSGLHDLTLGAEVPGGQRSVQLLAGCMWHGHVTNGEATNA